ncbi:C40 family peptidase [Microtetraspora malaysiensis]|uniref:C40 family peptidase n=1 Tax=Microtetraspora malaysiensis TaxID=161358 RepID=A0ABW6SY93_9ACTN
MIPVMLAVKLGTAAIAGVTVTGPATETAKVSARDTPVSSLCGPPGLPRGPESGAWSLEGATGRSRYGARGRRPEETDGRRGGDIRTETAWPAGAGVAGAVGIRTAVPIWRSTGDGPLVGGWPPIGASGEALVRWIERWVALAHTELWTRQAQHSAALPAGATTAVGEQWAEGDGALLGVAGSTRPDQFEDCAETAGEAAADGTAASGAPPVKAGELGPKATGTQGEPAVATRGDVAVKAAESWLGTPYTWGGGAAGGPSKGVGRGAARVGFDCSGLVMAAWAKAGVELGHYTGTQFRQGNRVALDEVRPGDLMFFGGSRGDPTHVGLYAGGGAMIHAPKTGDVVKKVDVLGSRHYMTTFRGAVRPA